MNHHGNVRLRLRAGVRALVWAAGITSVWCCVVPPLARAQTVLEVGALVLPLPQRWSVTKRHEGKGQVKSVELLNKDAHTRAFAESRPDQPEVKDEEALQAWAKAALPSRVAAYELQVKSVSRIHGLPTVRARFDADVRGTEPEQHTVFVTLVRAEKQMLAIGVLVPRGRELAREKDIEALLMAMEIRGAAPAPSAMGPPDPEPLAPETHELTDEILGVRLVAPKALRVKRSGRRPFQRRLRLRSPKGTLSLTARVVPAPRRFDLAVFVRRLEAKLRRRHSKVTPLPDAQQSDAEPADASTATRAYHVVLRGRGKPSSPRRARRVVVIVVRAPEVQRAYVVTLTAHPHHFLVREEVMTGLVSSFRLWPPASKAE